MATLPSAHTLDTSVMYPMVSDELIENALLSIDPTEWDQLREEARQDLPHHWRERTWYHLKHYIRSRRNEGYVPQQGEHGEIEVPYERELFYPSPRGRFALGSRKAVAYFAMDITTNFAETILQFRSNRDFSYHRDLLPYVYGQTDPDPGRFGYSLMYKMDDTAVFLDLTRRGSRLLTLIGNHISGKRSILLPGESEPSAGNGFDFVDAVVMDRSGNAAHQTQIVAKAVFRNGFDGIVYKSVRGPFDVSTPDACLVVYNGAMVCEAYA